MATVCTPAIVLPEHVVTQQEFMDALRKQYAGEEQLDAKLRLATNTTIRQRYFATPLEQVFKHRGIAKRMDDYVDSGLCLALSAIRQALDNAQLTKQDITHLIVTSCTIPSVLLPGLDAYILNAFEFPQDVRRLPIAQMGCHAGATALAQA